MRLRTDFLRSRRRAPSSHRSGVPDGKGFPFTTFLYNESQQNRDIAVEFQAMWVRHLGVNVNLALQEWKVYLNSLSSLDYGIARSSWVGDYPDPNRSSTFSSPATGITEPVGAMRTTIA